MVNDKINSNFKHLVNVLGSKRFLDCQILCNEVPFFIAPYDIKDEETIVKVIPQIKNKLLSQEIKVLEVNIYDLIVDLLKQTGDWEWYVENESTISKDSLKEDLQSILDVENVVTPKIVKIMEENSYDIMFLTGIGEVFPYIRSHNILNNLQKFTKDKPVVMFFPGEYINQQNSGSTLNLFGKLKDDKYYRAANIFEIQEV